MVSLPVGAKRLEFPNIDRTVISAHCTGAFAQNFLRAKTPAYLGKIGSQPEYIGGFIILSPFYGEQSPGNVIVQRAPDNAWFRSGAMNAARGFNDCLLFAITREDHIEVFQPFNRRLFRGSARGNMDPLDPSRVKIKGFGIVRFFLGEKQKFIQ
jgi:hypothetical protein